MSNYFYSLRTHSPFYIASEGSHDARERAREPASRTHVSFRGPLSRGFLRLPKKES